MMTHTESVHLVTCLADGHGTLRSLSPGSTTHTGKQSVQRSKQQWVYQECMTFIGSLNGSCH